MGPHTPPSPPFPLKGDGGGRGEEDRYAILGVKAKDFEDFKQVVKLMNSGNHLRGDRANQTNPGRNESRKNNTRNTVIQRRR